MDKDDKGWEEAVSHILEAGKASIDSRAAMRQLGEMVGSYYLGLVDAGLAPEQAALRCYEYLYAFVRLHKEGLI